MVKIIRCSRIARAIRSLSEIEDWQSAGLLKLSSIKPAISTIEQRLVLKKLGKLSPKDLILMENAIKEFLDLK